MGRPLKQSVIKKFSEELAFAEKAAKTGYDPKTKTLDPSIYGPTNIKFDPMKEMQKFHNNNFIDDNIMEASMTEFKSQEEAIMLEKSALEAVAKEAEIPVVEALAPSVMPSVQQEVMMNETSEEDFQLSEDPVERLKQVASKLKEALGNSAPTFELLQKWKAMHGDIFILQLEERLFIYRYLKRQEWVQMQANQAIQNLRPDQHEDMLFTKCLLWPQLPPQAIAALPAGITTLIVEQIRLQSMFLDPVQVANITLKI